MSRKLLNSVTNYSIGSLLFSLAGLISFPILTRLLSLEDYGLLALIASILTFIVGLSKAGLQHSTLRFYSEISEGKKGWNIDNYYSTVFYGMGTIGIIVTVLWLVVSQALPSTVWNNDQLPFLLGLTSILIFIRVVDSILVNIIRAKEYTGLYNTYRVIKRYFTLAAVLFVLYFVSRELVGIYMVTIFVESVVAVALIIYLFREKWPSYYKFSLPLFKSMLLFGIPMLGYELAGVLLSMGDRYIIQWYLGAQKLGIYAAAYNLTEMVHSIIVASFGQAILPMYLRIWSKKGDDAAKAFINRSFYYYVMISMPIIAGLSAVSPELLPFLASEKYSEGSVIIPYVISGMVIDGTVVIVGAGLYIHKQSKSLMFLVASSALVNIILNIFLVPAYGIEGAAVATLISYFLLAWLTFLFASRVFQVTIPWDKVLKSGCVSIMMYWIVTQVKGINSLSTLFIQVVVGIVVYSLLIIAIDAQARVTIRDFVSRFNGWKFV